MTSTTRPSNVQYLSTRHPQKDARPPPHSIDAEQALLGAILLDNRAADRVSHFLQPEHFYDTLHQQVYDVTLKVIAAGNAATPITIAPYFPDVEAPDGLTAAQYFGRLAGAATTIFNVGDYGRTVLNLADRRQLIAIGEDMVRAAVENPIDHPPQAQVEEAEVRLFALGERGKRSGRAQPFSSAAAETLEQASQAYQQPGGVCGLKTYLGDLDAKLGGLQNSDLIVVAGRPSMGKTALAINNFAFKNAQAFLQTKGEFGARVGVFSMEMSSAQLALRVLAEQAEIPSERIRRGMIDEGQFYKFMNSARRNAEAPIFIDQSGGLTVAQVSARARRRKREQDIGLLVIDYIQLMQGANKRSRVEDVSEITMGLKALAKDLDIPIVALSQLSRNVEHRADKRPQLSDLRESGSIEQDADVVMFVYREEYYVERERPDESDEKFGSWMARMTACTGKAELIIGKQRHGPCGKVDVQFDGPLTRFANMARPQFMPGHEAMRHD